MLYFTISIAIIVITAIALYRKLNPQGILITAGLAMCIISLFALGNSIELKHPTGNAGFDIIKLIDETFVNNISRAGLMIMTIGGYVAFMNHIEATQTLVRLSMKPLSFMRRFPMLAAVLTIPIGQMLFITTPSATGLGLLLVASIYPILTSLGVSRLTALSMIAATTLFDQGPGSANTALAAQLIGINNVEYFISHQLPLVIPTTIIVMITFCISNWYFDKYSPQDNGENVNVEAFSTTAPAFYALFPILPLILLVVFSPYVGLINPPIKLDTTTAMFASLFTTMLIHLLRIRHIKKVYESISAFWKGMGNVFGKVVTLIVASEIFSKGLIQLHFIDSLIQLSTGAGFSELTIVIVFSLIIFGAAVLMGSGNAAFFSFGPLMPGIATQLGIPSYIMILPSQLASSMGRSASPIAGVIVAIAGVAGASPIELAKRNLVPLTLSVIFLITYHIITL
nr:C4-dicarboxylate transporter DcuC [Prevotella sp.]